MVRSWGHQWPIPLLLSPSPSKKVVYIGSDAPYMYMTIGWIVLLVTQVFLLRHCILFAFLLLFSKLILSKFFFFAIYLREWRGRNWLVLIIHTYIVERMNCGGAFRIPALPPLLFFFFFSHQQSLLLLLCVGATFSFLSQYISLCHI